MEAKTTYPGFNDEGAETNSELNNELDAEINRDADADNVDEAEDLKYNEKENSFEYDVEGAEQDYDHPDPYNTSAKNGKDYDSTYDEQNPQAADEYIPNENLETDVENLGMHIDKGNITHVKPSDEKAAHTPEDDRDDLDAEGYPKNDLDDYSKEDKENLK